MANIFELSKDLRSIYNMFENGEGIDIETGEIKPEIMQALTLTRDNLQEKALDYGYVIKGLEYELECYDKEIKRLTERKRSIDKTIDRLKDILSGAMQEFDIVEIKGQTLKLSFRKSEQVEVPNIYELDLKYIKVKHEVDKVAIKQALKNGEVVEGATLVEKNNLQIR